MKKISNPTRPRAPVLLALAGVLALGFAAPAQAKHGWDHGGHGGPSGYAGHDDRGHDDRGHGNNGRGHAYGHERGGPDRGPYRAGPARGGWEPSEYRRGVVIPVDAWGRRSAPPPSVYQRYARPGTAPVVIDGTLFLVDAVTRTILQVIAGPY